MKIHRGPRLRPLEVSGGHRIDRDPLFKPVWYDGLMSLDPTDAPEPEILPPDPVRAKWEAVIERANEVTERLREDPEFNGDALVAVVTNLVDMDPSVDEIVAAYRKRMAALKVVDANPWQGTGRAGNGSDM